VSDGDRDWKLSVLAGVTSDPRIRAEAWRLAEVMRERGDPELTAADLAGSVAYLRVCLLRRSEVEIAAMTSADHAGLWALGCLGCARYRARRAVRRDRAGKRHRKGPSTRASS
jgi:hypothetical protein